MCGKEGKAKQAEASGSKEKESARQIMHHARRRASAVADFEVLASFGPLAGG